MRIYGTIPNRIIELKTFPEYFVALNVGFKTFEIRKEDDTRFLEGDILIMREFKPNTTDGFTGRVLYLCVTYICRGKPYLPAGTAVLGVRVLKRYDE